MKLKTYQAYTMAEALAAVKRDLGEDAVILNTRTFLRGGLLGIGRKTIVEVTATPAAEAQAENRQAAAPPRPRPSPAQRAYIQKSHPAAAGTRPRSTIEPKQIPAVQDDLLRTQRLAMAMEEKNRRADGQVPDARPAGFIPRPPLSGNGQRSMPRDAAAPPEPGPTTTPAAGTRAAAAGPAPARAPVTTGSPEPTAPIASAARRFVISASRTNGQMTLSEVKPAPAMPEAERASGPNAVQAGALADPGARVVSIPASADRDEAQEWNPAAEHRVESIRPQAEAALPPAPSPDPVPVPVPAAAGSPAALSMEMQDELASIKAMVGQVLHRQSMSQPADALPTMPSQLFEMYLAMIRQEISNELANQIVNEVRAELSQMEIEDSALVRQCSVRRLAAMIPVAPIQDLERPADGRPLTIVLIGPTGVGKTTTLAKLAATFKLRFKRSVGLITSDTYRIAAVDQLRTYADIIGIPLEVVLSPADMGQAIANLSACDVVLVDTAGRSQNDTNRIQELKAFVTAANAHEVHLVLSGTAGQRVLLHEARAFSEVGVDKVVLTKLDEAVSFGMLINVIRQVGKQLSFITTGQEVPEHLEFGKAERLASLVLGEPVHT